MSLKPARDSPSMRSPIQSTVSWNFMEISYNPFVIKVGNAYWRTKSTCN